VLLCALSCMSPSNRLTVFFMQATSAMAGTQQNPAQQWDARPAANPSSGPAVSSTHMTIWLMVFETCTSSGTSSRSQINGQSDKPTSKRREAVSAERERSTLCGTRPRPHCRCRRSRCWRVLALATPAPLAPCVFFHEIQRGRLRSGGRLQAWGPPLLGDLEKCAD